MTKLKNALSKTILFVMVFMLAACGNASQNKTMSAEDKAELEEMLAYIKSNLVFIKGGTFAMGRIYNRNREYIKFKKAYNVTLSDFYMSSRLITHEEYDLFARLNGIDIYENIDKKYADRLMEFNINRANPMSAAGMFPNRAEQYCSWLAEQTGLPFALPTEAQWEYVAFNRANGGYEFFQSTNNGYIANYLNYPGQYERVYFDHKFNMPLQRYKGIHGAYVRYSVDQHLPTPSGVYFVNAEDGDNEIVGDWKHDEYYNKMPSVVINPTGPQEPDEERKKVLRSGGSRLSFYYSIDDYRIGMNKNPMINKSPFKSMYQYYDPSAVARCVVNQPSI